MNIRKVETLAVWVTGLALAAAALAIMIGWHANWGHVVQVPGLVPIQFNTALTFFISSLALLAAEARLARTSALAAAAVFCFATAIGLQYVLNADFGIDRMFFKPYLQVRTTHPGRMAPNTALAFMLFSAALIYWHRGSKPAARFNVMAFCNVTLLLIGVITLSGYLAKVEAAYSWWGLSDMAPQTAAGLVLLGACSFGYARVFSRQVAGSQTRLWLPAYAALAGVILTLLIAQGMLVYHKNFAQETVAQETRRLASLIDLALHKFSLQALQRMQERFLFPRENARPAWEADAAHYIRDNAAYHSIVLLDANFGVTDIVPPGRASEFWRKAAASLRARQDESTAHVTGIIRLPGEPALIVLYLPLRGGYIAAAYKIEEAVAQLIGSYSGKDFFYTLLDSAKKVIYTNGTGQEEQAAWDITRKQELEIAGLKWTLAVTPDIAAFQNNGLVLLVFFFGFAISLLLSNSLYHTGKTRVFQKRLEVTVDQLQRSNTELEQFAYVASHDLKAPLRGIDNLALWIAEDMAAALTPQAKEQFHLLHKRVARLETMLEDILRYSRAGHVTDRPEPVNVGELLQQITQPLTINGKFRVKIEGRMPVMTVHRTPLEQVFSNLVVNAMKHHDRETGVLTIGAIPRGRFYEFYVKDDGPGIPPQFHEKVFQMFQTLQPRDKKEGIGLGMAIVKKLVEWQGGKVWIDSNPGIRGTTFRFLWRDQGGA